MSRHKLITCILTKQVARQMITRLKEEKFYFLFRELELDQPHQGMIYQEAVSKSTNYSLPDLSSST
jgi:hypothetical protein